MTSDTACEPAVLIVSDVATEVELVRSLIEEDIDNVLTAVVNAAEVFRQSRASVLVLAYKDLQEAKQFYLSLFHRGTEPQTQVHPHHAILLCDRRDVKAAYELCIEGRINDYVQFWPTTHDAPRLLMAVRQALRDCTNQFAISQAAAALAAQGDRMKQLEAVLSQYIEMGSGHVVNASAALTRAETGSGAALDDLAKQIINGSSVQLRPGRNPEDLTRELLTYRTDSILPDLKSLSRTLARLTDWVGKLEETVAPHVCGAREQLERGMPQSAAILIVDDDPFQRQMVGRVVESAGYRAFYAGDGPTALNLASEMQPDLILMDVSMPDMSGLDVVQKLKATPKLAKIPVIMVSGKSEREVVLESAKLGISNFVVKPIDRKVLLGRIVRLLTPAKSGVAPDVVRTRESRIAQP